MDEDPSPRNVAPGTRARRAFDEQLADLKARVNEMADLAEWMLQEGATSLVELDEAKANDVLRKKDELADLDDGIEQEALLLVARQQPMARDMRAIGAALKLITYINRVGRYGKDLAQITTQWRYDEHFHSLVHIPEMVETTARMLALVLEAYHDEATFDLDQLIEWEDKMDHLRWSIFRECLTHMAEDPQHLEAYAYYMMIARYLERCADNVCKMAEKIHYMVEGERVTIG